MSQSLPLGISLMISHPGAGAIESQIPVFAALGFDSFFLSCGVTADFEHIPAWAALGRRCGIAMEAVHAPTDGVNALWSAAAADTPAAEAYLARARRLIELCAGGEVSRLVLHTAYGTPPPASAVGLARFSAMEAHASAHGVALCYENATSADHLIAAVENASPGHGFCYDAGHEQCYTPDAHYLDRLGRQLLYTHLHDNHRTADEHLLPYDGARDWDALATALARIGYAGTLNAELACLYRPDYAALPYRDFLAEAHARLTQLNTAIEAARRRSPRSAF